MNRTIIVAALCLAALPVQQAAAQKYKFTPVKDGKMMTSMHDINAKGVAVGGSFAALGDVRTCLILTGKKMTTLDDPNEVSAGNTECWGLNSKGTIVGDYINANNATVGYIYANGVFTDVSVPKAQLTIAYGVNDSNEVIGYYTDPTGGEYGFTFDGTTYTKLAVKKASITQGFGIDNAGDYTLIATLADGLEHSYLVSGGTQTELVFPKISQVAAHHLNNKGQISATVIDSSNADHAGIYDGTTGKYYVLDDPKGVGMTIGDGINDKLELAGRYNTSKAVSLGFLATGKLK
jgi:hypothetical protein